MRTRQNGIIIFLNILITLMFFSSSFGATVTYTYDNLNRLTKAIYDNGTTEEFTYDAAGNRLSNISRSVATATPTPATNVTSNLATINGTVNPNGLPTTYYFEWGTTTTYGNFTSSQSAGSGMSNIAASINLTGLNPNTGYHYRLVATNSAGTGYGSDMPFATSTVPPTVTTGLATNVTPFLATLNGTVNPNGLLSNYYFEWGPTISYGNTLAAQSAGSAWSNVAVSANLTGLTFNAIYHYRLVASNSKGTIYGSDETFTARSIGFDFNGDGRTDILWRHTPSGMLYSWFIDGESPVFQDSPGTVDPTWEIKGIGDFNGDGKADILWRHAVTGQVYIWEMDGTTTTSLGSPGTVDMGWEIKGVGDFNGDGKADILWRHKSTGMLYIWLMDGTNITSMGSPGTVDLGWEIKGVGDFNGDGNADILWRNTSIGQLYIWLMNGTTITSMGSPATISDPNWQIKGVGDFNGDGEADILWRNAVSGQLYVWLMNGTAIASMDSPATLGDMGWEIKGVGDFNGDGKADILWRHKSTGMLYIWLMDGTNITSMGSPGTVGDNNWQIATP